MISKRYISIFLGFLVLIGALCVIFPVFERQNLAYRLQSYLSMVNDRFNPSLRDSVFQEMSRTVSDLSTAFDDVNGLGDILKGIFDLLAGPIKIVANIVKFLQDVLGTILDFFVYVLMGGGGLG